MCTGCMNCTIRYQIWYDLDWYDLKCWYWDNCWGIKLRIVGGSRLLKISRRVGNLIYGIRVGFFHFHYRQRTWGSCDFFKFKERWSLRWQRTKTGRLWERSEKGFQRDEGFEIHFISNNFLLVNFDSSSLALDIIKVIFLGIEKGSKSRWAERLSSLELMNTWVAYGCQSRWIQG